LIVPARLARDAFGMISAFTLLVIWLGHSFVLPNLADDIPDLGHAATALGIAAGRISLEPGALIATGGVRRQRAIGPALYVD
jgi:hypothetical protein